MGRPHPRGERAGDPCRSLQEQGKRYRRTDRGYGEAARHHLNRADPSDSHGRVFFAELTEASAYQKIYRNFKTTAEEIGVPEASPHWFRHSRLTHLGLQMLEEGKSYPEIKERLRRYGRHRSGETTEIYIKILKNRKAESVSQYSTITWEE